MTKRALEHLVLGALTSAALVALPARAHLQERQGDQQQNQNQNQNQNARHHDGDDDDDDDRPTHAIGQVPSGQFVTPTAIDGSVQQFLNPGFSAYPDFVAGEAVRVRLSPDGTTLAILTAGQNSLYKPDGSVDTAASTQFLFIYDVTGANAGKPALLQVIQQVNAHVGLVFSADSNTLYAAGGSDDAVYVYTRSGNTFGPATKIALNHYAPGATGSARAKGVGLSVEPNVAGMDLSADGRTLVVANNYNDSISVIDTVSRTVRYEHDLRPFFARNENSPGGIGGTFPYAVVMKGNETAYVSSDRDREVVVVDVSSATEGKLVTRIKLDGNALGMTLDKTQARLYVAQDNADQVAIVDTASNKVVDKVDARAPQGLLPNRKYTGAATSAVTLSPDGRTLYAVNTGANSIAVIPLVRGRSGAVSGLIPTSYEPHDIAFSADGSFMYIVNGKADATGPNPGHLSFPTGNPAGAAASRAANQYQFQLERATLVSAPVPTGGQLEQLTDRVARNNFYTTKKDEKNAEVMRFLNKHINHVIYVVKENRTYDQVLGDLTNGSNNDATLTQFGQGITPNYHNLATQFVTLDNFRNPGDGSMDGWSWALQGRVTNTEALAQQLNYAAVDRGMSYDTEGANRNVPVNYKSVAERDAVAGVAGTKNYSAASAGLPGGTLNLLTGDHNHASTDAPFGIENGYIFSAALNAGRSVRNYGFLVNNIGSIGTKANPVIDPFGSQIIQVGPLSASLAPMTDVYFRGFDQDYPDLWRYNEWKREFDEFVANGQLPALSLVRVSHDHMGNFGTALAGINTPETQQADCDYAVGLLVQAVANSRYARDTVIIITEDDVQDGPDHVDSHRGPAFVVGAYVKKGGEVISTRYSQVNALRTIEDILGTEHINLNTAFATPMADVFDIRSNPKWSYTAEASSVLGTTTLLTSVNPGKGGVKFAKGPMITPQHDAAYWEAVTAGFDFSEADQVPPGQFNRVLWTGLMGNKPYPARSGQTSSGTKE